MAHKIEIATLPEYAEAQKKRILHSIEENSGFVPTDIGIISGYSFDGNLSYKQLEAISEKLLRDPVTQLSFIDSPAVKNCDVLVEIRKKPGVLDPVAETVKRKLPAEAVGSVNGVYTTYQLAMKGVSPKEARMIAKGFYNIVIEKAFVTDCSRWDPTIGIPPYVPKIPKSGIMFEKVDLSGSDADLQRISNEMDLALNLTEMKEIKNYFGSLKRSPTDVELEIIAQTWSDHCKHKRFNAPYRYKDATTGEEVTYTNGLLKDFIQKATNEIASPGVVSSFKDNAGVVRFGDDYVVLIKYETHNHPSNLEPKGGSETGEGGVIRDILGCGLGARPIAGMDVFLVGYPHTDKRSLPKDVIQPKRLLNGLIEGIISYGNKMGIPTVNGAVYFGEAYGFRSLMYGGNVGIAPAMINGKPWHEKCAQSGDYILVIGGKTGKDGIHGATLSSKGGETRKGKAQKLASQSVQCGNPINERRVLDCQMKMLENGYYDSTTDFGAGGISCATGEMGTESNGADVDISKEPLKYKGLRFSEIIISEAQERMLFAVPEKYIDAAVKIGNEYDANPRILGRFNNSGKYIVRYGKQIAAEIDMKFMHKGVPLPERLGIWTPPKNDEPKLEEPSDMNAVLKAVLSRPNIASKEAIVRQYDHEVQAATIGKPFVGAYNDGPSDAAVLWPIEMRRAGKHLGVIIANGLCPRRSYIDTALMTQGAIDEAVRNAVAVGASVHPEKLYALDNFSWSDPDNPQSIAELVRAAKAWYETTKEYGIPTISGKDSMSNDRKYKSKDGTEKKVSIPRTLLVPILGIADDVRKSVTMDIKEPGNAIYILGATDADELGASEYFEMYNAIGNNAPKLDAKTSKQVYQKLHEAMYNGWVRSCHDCSDGGLGVTLAEMAFAGDIGIEAYLHQLPRKGSERSDYLLFSESNGRLVAEVPSQYKVHFEKLFSGLPVAYIGHTGLSKDLVVYGTNKKQIINVPLSELKAAWQMPII